MVSIEKALGKSFSAEYAIKDDDVLTVELINKFVENVKNH